MALVLIFNLQNMMRPIMTSRYDDLADSEEQATILSVEEQANSSVVFLMAPLLGYLVDHYHLAYSFLLCSILIFFYLAINNYQQKRGLFL